MTDHIADPLDYLYEELPPERMAEARRHLAECPECRAAMRGVRETVKLYRQAPRPAPPEGLAARAARAAIEAGDNPARRRMPAAARAEAPDGIGGETPSAPPPAAASKPPEGREETLEKDFERLKDEVRGEMRAGWWRRWFFHPAWTVAAMALLLGSLAIHFSPRGRDGGEARPGAPLEGAAKSIRNRERIPAVAPAAPAKRTAAPAGGKTASPALAEARARDLPLPDAAPTPLHPPAEPARVAAAPAPGLVVSTPLSMEEIAPLLGPDELAALVDSSGDAGADVLLNFAEMEPPQLVARPEGFDIAGRIRTLTALAGMQIAAGEIADARKTIEMLRRYDATAAEELGLLLAGREQAALAEAEAAEAAAAATESAAAQTTGEAVGEPAGEPAASPAPPPPEEEPVRVRLVERPRPAEPAESAPPEQPEQPEQPEPPAQTPPAVPAVPAAPSPEPAPAPSFPDTGAAPEPVSVFSLPRYAGDAAAAGMAGAAAVGRALPVAAGVPLVFPDPPAPVESSPASAASAASAPVYSEPIAELPPEEVFVEDAPPPALPEAGAGPFRMSIRRGARERGRFTTDPYLRDD